MTIPLYWDHIGVPPYVGKQLYALMDILNAPSLIPDDLGPNLLSLQFQPKLKVLGLELNVYPDPKSR